MNACASLSETAILSQQIGFTTYAPGPGVKLGEKIMMAAAVDRRRSGRGYVSSGAFDQAEQLLTHCQAPPCHRDEVGSTGIGRRACCMGLSMAERRSSVLRHPVVYYRSEELQAATKHICQMVRSEYPELLFSSLQINLNARAALRSNSANVGLSAVAAFGNFAGGQIYTLDYGGEPVVMNIGGTWALIDGRIPHAVLPYDGYRLSVVAFLHPHAFYVSPWEARKLEALGFRIPLSGWNANMFPT